MTHCVFNANKAWHETLSKNQTVDVIKTRQSLSRRMVQCCAVARTIVGSSPNNADVCKHVGQQGSAVMLATKRLFQIVFFLKMLCNFRDVLIFRPEDRPCQRCGEHTLPSQFCRPI